MCVNRIYFGAFQDGCAIPTSTQKKSDIFREYYQHLYSSESPLISHDDWFLEMVNKEKNSLEHKEFLGEPIYLKEIMDTIDWLK